MAEPITPRNPYFDETRPDRGPSLKRSLGFWGLTLYGLGTIIGAGIYVLVGEVAGRAGMGAPLAFVAAGIVAGLTGLSYAELVARHPEAAGETAYVQEAFGIRALAQLAGVALIFVAIIAAASIAKGAAGYLEEYVPLPRWAGGAAIVALFTAIAAVGVSESVRVAVVMTLIEIGGLVFIVAAAAPALEALPARAGELVPRDLGHWADVFAGMFVAFFAFIGFDTLANMAEETEEVARTLPRAILAAVGISAVLYGLVALVSVFVLSPADLSAHDAPLVAVLEKAGFSYGRHFAAIALIATANGVMIEIMLVSRLAYGMARRRLLPGWFSAVNARTRTPLRATLLGGALILALVAAVPFSVLVSATSTVTLAVFALVNLSLARLQMKDRRADLAIRAPRWAPPLAAATCLGLIVAQFTD
jgi:basic amino acid/polyamine antiporter, APA family